MRRLEATVRPHHWKMLCPRARADLVRHLTARFTTNLGKAFHAIITATGDSADRDRANLKQALTLFPAFGETLRLIEESWISAQGMMLARLHRDYATIARYLKASSLRIEIVRLVAGLSDSHDGGTVALIELMNRRRFIYKPRSGGGEEIWFGILDWLNREGFQPQFRIPAIISRSRYHWMEFLRPMECTDKSAVERFYLRWGAQTALCDAVGMVDLHHENWIAAGEQPILVDVETFGRKAWQLRKKGTEGAAPLPSLLRTGLFPFGADRNLGAYAAIAPFDPSTALRESLAWPRCGGITHLPAQYAEQIATGYDLLTRFVWRNASRRSKLSRMIRRAAGRSDNRVFVRSSGEYQRLLLESLRPHEILGAGTRFDFLLRNCAQTAPSRSVAMAEAEELLRCSIPRFASGSLPTRGSAARLPSIAAMRRSIKLLRSSFVDATAQLHAGL